MKKSKFLNLRTFPRFSHKDCFVVLYVETVHFFNESIFAAICARSGLNAVNKNKTSSKIKTNFKYRPKIVLFYERFLYIP